MVKRIELMFRKIVVILPLILIIVLLTPLVVFAQEVSQSERVVLEENQTVNKDYFAAGKTVSLSGTVNGDAYVAGGNIFIDGTINGDLLVAGGTVTIRGTVSDDVRALGGTVTVSGDIGKNVTVGAGTTVFTDNARIGGSIVAGAGTLEVFAPVGKGMTFGAGQATLGSRINGDILAGIGQLTLTNDARIHGDLTYYSEADEELTKANSASVSGKITHNVTIKDEKISTEKTAGALAGFGFFLKLLSLFSALILGLLLIHFFPLFTKRTADRISNQFFLTLFIGFVTFLLMPVLIILLFITLLGIPFAIILLPVILVYVFFAKIFAALFIGERVLAFLNQKTSIGWKYFVGLVIYGFLTVIPIFGWIVSLLALFTGTGALLLEKRELYTSLRSKKLI